MSTFKLDLLVCIFTSELFPSDTCTCSCAAVLFSARSLPCNDSLFNINNGNVFVTLKTSQVASAHERYCATVNNRLNDCETCFLATSQTVCHGKQWCCGFFCSPCLFIFHTFLLSCHLPSPVSLFFRPHHISQPWRPVPQCIMATPPLSEDSRWSFVLKVRLWKPAVFFGATMGTSASQRLLSIRGLTFCRRADASSSLYHRQQISLMMRGRAITAEQK